MSKKIKLKILGLSSSQSQSGSFALILGEVGGNRRLPIIIGVFEAQAIAIEIEDITPNRPMTHDLFKSFSKAFQFSVNEIFISDLKEGVFFAKILCNNEHSSHEIDSRPSDAIAIGLRFNIPIYTNEEVMSKAGIILSEDDELVGDSEPMKKDTEESLSDFDTDRLQELLNEALEREDYEAAAKIRDELQNRGK